MPPSRRAQRPRIAWEDRYEVPTLDDLLAHLPRPLAQLALQARGAMLSLGSLQDAIVWQGVAWKWTITLMPEGETSRPWAYIIPQPARPLVSVPLTAEIIAGLPARKLSKAVRDGIQSASCVGDACWPLWELTTKQQLEDIMVVVRHKHDLMREAVGAGGDR